MSIRFNFNSTYPPQEKSLSFFSMTGQESDVLNKNDNIREITMRLFNGSIILLNHLGQTGTLSYMCQDIKTHEIHSPRDKKIKDMITKQLNRQQKYIPKGFDFLEKHLKGEHLKEHNKELKVNLTRLEERIQTAKLKHSL